MQRTLAMYPGLRTKYDHYRFDDGSAITACSLIIKGSPFEGHTTAKGVAVCSPKDPFSKKLGRRIALGRALKAYEIRRSTCPVDRKNVSGQAFEVASTLGYKALFFPEGKIPFADLIESRRKHGTEERDTE